MKRTFAIACLAFACSGCSVFFTTQGDRRDGETTKITTRTLSFTLFTSQSDLANFKVQQTEKTQSATVGTLKQQSTEPEVLEKAVDKIP